MAIRYDSLELRDDALFGIGLSGTVGRPDKQKLLDLADKCLERGKLRLILDLSGLSAIGGGGAKVLSEFQERLVASDGEAVFVGANQVVRRFLAQKFEKLPLRFFPAVGEAEIHFDDPKYRFDPDAVDAAADEARRAAEQESEQAPDADSEVGAVGFNDDEDEDAPAAVPSPPSTSDEAKAAVSEVLEEFNGADEDEAAQAPGGRRKDHHYTSLADAMETLARWSPFSGQSEFASSLRNLLFSHDLADDVIILTGQDDLLVDEEQSWEIPQDGGLARQVSTAVAPLTLLDVQEYELSPAEIRMLEELTPDLMLPVKRAGRLDAVIMLTKGTGDHEYTVAEHFALELLMRVLSGGGSESVAAPATAARSVAAPAAGDRPQAAAPEWQADAGADEQLSGALLNLALNLPEADDTPHFWRLFARHAWSVLPLQSLGYLAPGMHKAQIIAGDSDHWKGVNLGEEKLRHFFRTMQRPVAVADLPKFFHETRDSLQRAGADWIVGLRWEDEFLGTVLFGTADEFEVEDPRPLLVEIFQETARLLHRFENSNDTADVNLGLLEMLVARREKRCRGTDRLTEAMSAHAHRLARIMGFAPDQERDLVYGCLLRDIGLVDKEDALMRPTTSFDPTQWPVYRQHPAEGAALLAGLNLPETVTDVVHAHHERFDGKGFPRGLVGRKIPLPARIATVIEGYVNLAESWCGSDASAEEAARHLTEDDGRMYDPDIVEVFLKSLATEDHESILDEAGSLTRN